MTQYVRQTSATHTHQTYLENCSQQAKKGLNAAQSAKGLYCGRSVSFLSSLKSASDFKRYMATTKIARAMTYAKSLASRTVEKITTLKVSMRRPSFLEQLAISIGALALHSPVALLFLTGCAISLLQFKRDNASSSGDGNINNFSHLVDPDYIEILCKAAKGNEEALNSIMLPSARAGKAEPLTPDQRREHAVSLLKEALQACNRELTKEQLWADLQNKIEQSESGPALQKSLDDLITSKTE